MWPPPFLSFFFHHLPLPHPGQDARRPSWHRERASTPAPLPRPARRPWPQTSSRRPGGRAFPAGHGRPVRSSYRRPWGHCGSTVPSMEVSSRWGRWCRRRGRRRPTNPPIARIGAGNPHQDAGASGGRKRREGKA
jgi:hypothetical protein